MISFGQNGHLDLRTGSLGPQNAFGNMEISGFSKTNSKFSFGAGYRMVAGNAGFMQSGAMSFSGLARFVSPSNTVRISTGPSLQLRNNKIGLGGVVMSNIQIPISDQSLLLSEIKLELGTRMTYLKTAAGIAVGKISFLTGFETIHDGFFTEVRYEIIDEVNVGVSYIKASKWVSENGTPRENGMALYLEVNF
jgi:hypothetical protein